MMGAHRILLVESMPSLRTVYTSMLESEGYDVTAVETAQEAKDIHQTAPFDLAMLDLVPEENSGVGLLTDLLAIHPNCAAIVVTSHASVNLAVRAMQAGARDFVIKPFDESHLLGLLRDAARLIPQSAAAPTTARKISGSCPKMREVAARISAVAGSDAPVFLTGASGTGKEVCARAVHDLSPRAGKPFVPINCGAIPAELMESELFGHSKGAFTGAVADKIGLAAAADGGTLFLDEICELSLSLQPKLLRFLENSTLTPVGATDPKRVNTRIICATNKDPLADVEAGRFRADLYYRLYVVPIHLPHLRERGEDVLNIAEETLQEFNREEGKHFFGLSDEVADLFLRHPWPGNVRQLRNVLRHVMVINDGPMVVADMLPREFLAQAKTAEPPSDHHQAPQIDTLIGKPLAEVERIVIEATISHFQGSVPRAAAALGISPSTIYRKRESWDRHHLVLS